MYNMANIFILVLILTGLITRILTHLLHDRNAYNKNTLTGIIRKKINFDLHHIHFGFILVIISTIMYFLEIWNLSLIILLAIGLSFIADQIFPILKVCDYFYITGISLSLINHLIIIIIYFIL